MPQFLQTKLAYGSRPVWIPDRRIAMVLAFGEVSLLKERTGGVTTGSKGALRDYLRDAMPVESATPIPVTTAAADFGNPDLLAQQRAAADGRQAPA